MRTTKGDFILTPDDAKAITAAAKDHGADLMIDYEHLAVRPVDAESGKAAGWFNLEARDDGLWAVNVRWSPLAAEMLKNSEYRYFSPAFSVDKKTREIKDLMNVALTNLPATKDLRPLVAARKGKQMTIAKEELAAALTQHMKKKGLSTNEMAEKCAIPADRIEKLAKGDGVPTDEEHEKCSTAMGYDSPSDEDDDSDAPMDDEDEDKGTPKTQEDSKVTTKKAETLESDLERLTGRSDPREQLGVLAAKLAKAEQYDADHKVLIELRKENDDRRRRELIERGKRDNKLTPSLIRYWASRDLTEFETYLDAAPTITGPVVEPAEPGSAKSVLTPEELEVCRQNGKDPEVFAKFVEDERSGRNRRVIEASYQKPDLVALR